MSYLLLCKPTVRDPIKRMGGKIQHCGVTFFQNYQKKQTNYFKSMFAQQISTKASCSVIDPGHCIL